MSVANGPVAVRTPSTITNSAIDLRDRVQGTVRDTAGLSDDDRFSDLSPAPCTGGEAGEFGDCTGAPAQERGKGGRVGANPQAWTTPYQHPKGTNRSPADRPIACDVRYQPVRHRTRRSNSLSNSASGSSANPP
ncbi:hypothetical protein GCM10009551_005020 [Nocardiopsis tropica]